jgi:hypothetical protein
MGDRRHDAERCCIADQDIEPAEFLVQRAAELVDRGAIGQIHRYQRRGSAGGFHRIVDFFQAADLASDQYKTCAFGRIAFCDGRADATTGAGDKCNPAFEPSSGRH